MVNGPSQLQKFQFSLWLSFQLLKQEAVTSMKSFLSNKKKSSKIVWLIVLCLIGLMIFYNIPSNRHQSFSKWDGSSRDILVLYIFSDSDPMYLDNLHFFVKEAVEGDQRSEFIILVPEDEAKDLPLPRLPLHARYVLHKSDCFDWGIYGWLLKNGNIAMSKYSYLMLINCSVRGPFIPPMLKEDIPWWHPFISKLLGNVKMVGSTISCEGSPLNGDAKEVWRQNPHVQSFALAMDKVALGILLRDKDVFKCHSSLWNTVYYSELGASAAVLDAGYNLDTLMVRYQNVDWRDERTWDCNERFSPIGENYNDGITLDPYEVVFVKAHSALVEQQVSSTMKAAKYTAWKRGTNMTERVITNDFLINPNKHRVPKILMKIVHGQQCFDAKYYLLKNPDLAMFNTELDLWKHFVYYGQFEPRQHRFTCPFDYSKFAAFA